jgi:hypothetical protein
MSKPTWTIPVTLPNTNPTYSVTVTVDTSSARPSCSLQLGGAPAVPLGQTHQATSQSGLVPGTINAILDCSPDYGFTESGCAGSSQAEAGKVHTQSQSLTMTVLVASP